jgi:hypothetical protein
VSVCLSWGNLTVIFNTYNEYSSLSMERQKLDRHYPMGCMVGHEYQQFGSMKVDHLHSCFAKQSKLGYRGTYSPDKHHGT